MLKHSTAPHLVTEPEPSDYMTAVILNCLNMYVSVSFAADGTAILAVTQHRGKNATHRPHFPASQFEKKASVWNGCRLERYTILSITNIQVVTKTNKRRTARIKMRMCLKDHDTKIINRNAMPWLSAGNVFHLNVEPTTKGA